MDQNHLDPLKLTGIHVIKDRKRLLETLFRKASAALSAFYSVYRCVIGGDMGDSSYVQGSTAQCI